MVVLSKGPTGYIFRTEDSQVIGTPFKASRHSDFMGALAIFRASLDERDSDIQLSAQSEAFISQFPY
jgi:hypothetical protein